MAEFDTQLHQDRERLESTTRAASNTTEADAPKPTGRGADSPGNTPALPGVRLLDLRMARFNGPRHCHERLTARRRTPGIPGSTRPTEAGSARVLRSANAGTGGDLGCPRPS